MARRYPWVHLPPRPPLPDPRAVTAIEAAYRRWASQHVLTIDVQARGYRGRLGRHPVLVRPGLDGSAPISVEIEIEIDHQHNTAKALITSKTAHSGDNDDNGGRKTIEHQLRALFDDEALAPHLRSIALIKAGVRLRFNALTSPELVELGATSAIDVLEQFVRDRADPYR